jgi:hypothetical protein
MSKDKNSEFRGLFPGALEMMILQSLRIRPMQEAHQGQV